jgi:sulfur carrier protein ThiS
MVETAKGSTIIIRNKEFTVESGIPLTSAIAGLGLDPESYIALRKGEMIALDTVLQAGDTVKLFPMISGGS